MDEKIKKKTTAYLSGLKSAVGRKASSWSEVSRLKSEIDRKNSEIHLQLQDVDNLKIEAGDLAYNRWKEGCLKQEDFNMLFGEVQKKEESMEALEASKLVLESQLHYAKTLSESSKQVQEDYPYACPACGAGYRAAANFCRKCGASLSARGKEEVYQAVQSEERGTGDQQSDDTNSQTHDEGTTGK